MNPIPPSSMPRSRKAQLFWPLVVALLVADCATKELAVEHLSPPSVPHAVLDDWLRLTLAYNRGAAMGLTLGPVSRFGFALLAVGALLVLFQLYRLTPPSAAGRTGALALLIAGAAGNLMDRLRSPKGVVDFIDVGVGSWRFWTFNLADACITLGALGLMAALWRARRDEGAGAC